IMTMANSGLLYPFRCRTGRGGRVNSDSLEAVPAPIELPGVPLGSFPGSSYDELTFELLVGDLFVFCTDGVSEANDALGREFGAVRLQQVIAASGHKSAHDLVDDIFGS